MNKMLLTVLVFFVITSPFVYVRYGSSVAARLSNNSKIYESSRLVAQPFLVGLDNPRVSEPSNYTYMGYLVDDEGFIQARNQYPSLLSCVSSSAKRGTHLDISYFNWPLFKNRSEAMLCVFYIADVLRSAEEMRTWLISQNFVIETYTGTESEVPSDAKAIRIYVVSELHWSARSAVEDNIVFRIIRSFVKPKNGSLFFDDNIGFSIAFLGDGSIYFIKSVPKGK